MKKQQPQGHIIKVAESNDTVEVLVSLLRSQEDIGPGYIDLAISKSENDECKKYLTSYKGAQDKGKWKEKINSKLAEPVTKVLLERLLTGVPETLRNIILEYTLERKIKTLENCLLETASRGDSKEVYAMIESGNFKQSYIDLAHSILQKKALPTSLARSGPVLFADSGEQAVPADPEGLMESKKSCIFM